MNNDVMSKILRDWEGTKKRLTAWWNCECLDRPCMAITARKYPGNLPPEPESLEEKWKNLDYVIAAQEAAVANTYYAAEAIPVLRPNLGPDLFASLLGGEIEYRETTSWVRPFIEDWGKVGELKLDTDSDEWRWHLDYYRRIAECSPRNYFLGTPDCHSGGDALMAMRGGSRLCMDIYDHPDEIKKAMRALEKEVVLFHETFFSEIEKSGQQGHTSSWLNVWSPGRSQAVQLDLLALISPKQFKEFYYEELVAQCEVLDYVIFHLDGPDAIKHLPLLYELPNVAAIQWVHGTGNGPMTRWIPLLKGIQAAGKSIHISAAPGEVRELLRQLRPEGLYIRTWADTPDEADAILELAEKR